MKKIKHAKWSALLFFTMLLVFSCSENDNDALENINQQENFVQLSQVKEIAGDILFSKKSTSNKGASTKPAKKTVKKINEIKNENGITSFYIINYAEGGFIILSSDKRTQPILAFSENNQFDVDESSYPPGLNFWLKDTKKLIKDIQSSNLTQSNKIKFAWKEVQNALSTNQSVFARIDPPQECYEHTETVTVGPLLTSTWYQTGGFNDSLPFITCSGSSFQVYAGCVPIAMGQVMKYHEYPTNYSWTSIPLSYATTTTANFIEDIHNAINTVYPGNPSYYCDGTGVSASANMGNVLKTQFNYSSASWANYNYSTVKSNLNSNRPVILSGDNGVSGHMWVCDGYMQTSFYFDDCTGGSYYPLFHMNWGWGGTNDGYYSYNNFNPGNTNYNNNKKMVYNIIP